ncbi:uncharacterized protein LOC133284805 [Gastrolobium bilobum]|uniref:uncharacterized protein LOC133284805 n=1 Tax=Gastrolobium bilobum TaxID=150636 RepID=UPI002AB2B4AF|nr:uncharacterized protein LOC133284805 [Gastrolobium bilobum]
MASVQCYKTCEESCQQKSQHSSLGQKVSELFKGHHNQQPKTQTQCCSQTEVLSQSGHLTAITQTQCCQTETTHTNGTPTKSQGRRTKREHKRNLFQKMKDGLSGHSSDSSSDSESDNENCQKRKD